ncbi:MAG: hypothetical protein CMO98_10600 [Woeseia sp.]|nr:hypothetical protein [Woeseia sp.]
MTLNETAKKMRLACALGLAAAGLSTAVADRRYEAKGTEFDITGRIIGDQIGTRLAIGAKGGYLVWQDNATDQFGLGISALKMDSAGNPVGNPVRINSRLKGDQENPQVGMLPTGGAIFAWEGGASGFHRVHFRITNPQGVFLFDDLFATGPNSGEQIEPSLTVLGNGNVVLSWTDYLEDGSFKGVSARLIGADGSALTDPFRLNEFTFGNQHKSSLVALPSGGFAAVWVSDQQQDAKSLDVVARIFSATGEALTGEVIVNLPGVNANPSLALSGDSIVVAWEQLNLDQTKHRWDIGTRSLDFDLKPLSEPVLANNHLLGDQFSPQLQGGEDGAMLVWNSLGQDKSREAIMGKFVSSTGQLLNQEIRVNTVQAHSQMRPAVSLSGDGDFLVAWSTPRQGKSGFDLVGQRFGNGEAPTLLPAISDLFVNAVSDTELLVSWPAVNGMNLKHYEVYFDGIASPKIFSSNHLVWPGLRPGSEYMFQVAYVLEDGRRSELSPLAVTKTWGRDFNGDGLPDDWQRQYFGTDADAWPGAALDSDGDGSSNEHEFAAGTDPSNGSDALSLSFTKLERGTRLEWDARLGVLYQLQQTSSLVIEDWANIGEPVLALEDRAGVTLETVKKMRFYRIKKVR